MKNTTLRSHLSALALAGLAAGLAAPAHAGTDSTQTSKAGCKAKTSCKGVHADSGAKAEDHTCSGTGHCGGAVAAAGVVDSTAKVKASLLGAKSGKEFAKACKAAGKKAEKTSCKGMNSCKGIYFTGSAASEVACKGQASCHGLVCAL
jgi:hypothetical protein